MPAAADGIGMAEPSGARPLGGRGPRGAQDRRGSTRVGVRAGGRDGRGPRPRLAGHPAARGGGPMGLEGVSTARRQSAFAGLMGSRVAAPGVTVLDDGRSRTGAARSPWMTKARPRTKTVLIEDGILVGYIAGAAIGAADGGCAHRQRPARKLRPRADDADDQTPTCWAARRSPPTSSPTSGTASTPWASAAGRSTSP